MDNWSAPQPNSAGGVYPFVTIEKTRGGHLFEVNDTLGSERIYQQHKSGTSEEITSTGDRIVTVYGLDYKVVHGSGHMTVLGDCNIIVIGNLNTIVNGDHNIEVNGNSIETIKGDKILKVGGRFLSEIVGEQATNIGTNHKVVVHGKSEHYINGGSTMSIKEGSHHTVIGDCVTTITGRDDKIVDGDASGVVTGISTNVAKTLFIGSSSDMSIFSGGKKTEEITGAWKTTIGTTAKIETGAALTITSGGDTIIKGTRISLN
jgi:hypothetical protein